MRTLSALPQLEFTTFFELVLPRRSTQAITGQGGGHVTGQGGGQVTGQVGGQVTGQVEIPRLSAFFSTKSAPSRHQVGTKLGPSCTKSVPSLYQVCTKLSPVVVSQSPVEALGFCCTKQVAALARKKWLEEVQA
jgi:hypothetical protein